jgi:hypothetical protein
MVERSLSMREVQGSIPHPQLEAGLRPFLVLFDGLVWAHPGDFRVSLHVKLMFVKVNPLEHKAISKGPESPML